jgi:hypothetical protein
MPPVLGVVRDARRRADVPGVRIQGDAGVMTAADLLAVLTLLLMLLAWLAAVVASWWWR